MSNKFHMQFTEKTARFLELPDDFPARVTVGKSDWHDGRYRVKIEIDLLCDWSDYKLQGDTEEIMFTVIPEAESLAQLVML